MWLSSNLTTNSPISEKARLFPFPLYHILKKKKAREIFLRLDQDRWLDLKAENALYFKAQFFSEFVHLHFQIYRQSVICGSR